MKNIFYKLSLALSLLIIISSCEIDEVNDPNNPSLGSVLNDANKSELQTLVSGLEGRHRAFYGSATQMFGSFGREVWAYFRSDARFVADWLGIGLAGETYPDFFASAGTYSTPYLAVKQANTLIEAANNSTALTEEERNGYIGFARTIKAYQLLIPLMQQYQNGIRVDVNVPLNPGPILSFDASLQAIRDLLDEAQNELSGSSFSFSLAGFDGFDSPESFIELNRAIAARASLYAEDWPGTLTNLSDSFFNLEMGADQLDVGPTIVYGEAPDVNNPLFYPLNAATNTILIVHPALLEDAIPGDLRVENKFFRRTEPVFNSGISDADGNEIPGEYQDNRWASNISPIKFIRNEELVLIYAEASAKLGNTGDTVDAINIIRNTWNIGNYTGGILEADLIDEILFQRRYSLWAEAGHRWIDLRRTNRLNETYIDLRDRGSIFTQVSRRTSETNWEAANS